MTSQAATTPPESCGSGGNFIQGAKVPGNLSVFGVMARIETKNPELCGSDSTGSSFSTAWAMISAASKVYPTLRAYDGYAQAGYIQAASGSCFDGECGDGKIRTFSEFTLSCKSTGGCGTWNTSTVFGPEVAVESSQYYQVYRIPSGTTYLVGAGQLLDTMFYDPTTVWDSKWRLQFEGETGHKESDIPGTSGDHTNFDTLEYYDLNDNPHYLSAQPPHDPDGLAPAQYKFENFTPSSGLGPYGIKIWTDPNHT
jgi:hypothetical protein